MSPGMEPIQVGQMIANRYRIEDRLGEGGMGTVWRAFDVNSERYVVVKVPQMSLLSEQGFRERFQREIRALIQLAHPNIVTMFDLGEVDGLPYAVMSYLAGGSLEDFNIRALQQVDYNRVLEWLRQVAAALDFVHEQGMIHRDIKPGNILFDESRNAYLADFGIAKVQAESPRFKVTQQITQSGMIVGTMNYMAPEAFRERSVTSQSDQYSLAVTVFEFLSGRRPYIADDPYEIARQHLAGECPALASLVRNLPAHMSDAVHRGLSTDPAMRFNSCREFASAVLAAPQAIPISGGMAPPPVPPQVGGRDVNTMPITSAHDDTATSGDHSSHPPSTAGTGASPFAAKGKPPMAKPVTRGHAVPPAGQTQSPTNSRPPTPPNAGQPTNHQGQRWSVPPLAPGDKSSAGQSNRPPAANPPVQPPVGKTPTGNVPAGNVQSGNKAGGDSVDKPVVAHSAGPSVPVAGHAHPPTQLERPPAVEQTPNATVGRAKTMIEPMPQLPANAPPAGGGKPIQPNSPAPTNWPPGATPPAGANPPAGARPHGQAPVAPNQNPGPPMARPVPGGKPQTPEAAKQQVKLRGPKQAIYFTCPWCWRKFEPEEVLWIAENPGLTGDSRIQGGKHRFLPERFTANGDALDIEGQACTRTACPHCHLAVPRDYFDLTPLSFSLLGSPSSGKTCYLTSLAWKLRTVLPTRFNMSFSDADPELNAQLLENEAKMFMSQNDGLASPDKTELEGEEFGYHKVSYSNGVVEYLRPYIFSLRPTRHHVNHQQAQRISFALSVYDNAGEHFQPGEERSQKPVTQHLGRSEAFLFVFDPSQHPRFRAAVAKHSDDPQFVGAAPRANPQQTILVEAQKRIRRQLNLSIHEQNERPLIVLVNKYDAWAAAVGSKPLEDPWIVSRDSKAATRLDVRAIEAKSASLRELLLKLCPEVVTAADEFSSNVLFVPTSSFGRQVETHHDGERETVGVMANELDPMWVEVPILYLLATVRKGVIAKRS